MTAKIKSERLRRLISHGYFAPELPPQTDGAGPGNRDNWRCLLLREMLSIGPVALHSVHPLRNLKKKDLFVVAPHGRARARS
jgi:hypothetical protein